MDAMVDSDPDPEVPPNVPLTGVREMRPRGSNPVAHQVRAVSRWILEDGIEDADRGSTAPSSLGRRIVFAVGLMAFGAVLSSLLMDSGSRGAPHNNVIPSGSTRDTLEFSQTLCSDRWESSSLDLFRGFLQSYGIVSCATAAPYCDDPSYQEVIRKACEVTCGMCDIGDTLPATPTPTAAITLFPTTAVGTELGLTPSPTPAIGTGLGTGGACDAGEELFQDLCYTACSAATQGALPTRTAACTCCRHGTAEECRNPADYVTDCPRYGKSRAPNVLDTPVTMNPGQCNLCNAGEEYHYGLCYKACSVATGGRMNTRTAACTCCNGASVAECSDPAKYETNCPKFAGDGQGKSPRIPIEGGHGSCHPCYSDEELYMGLCYKTCSNASQGSYPTRVGPCSCCSEAPCEGDNVQTDCPSFGVSAPFPRAMPPAFHFG